jgi:hypothetical protein
MQDHYALLGVTHTATRAEIRAAYLAKIRAVHPDATGDQAEDMQAKLLTLAWHCLGDSDRRASYDAIIGGSSSGPSGPNAADESIEIFERIVNELVTAGLDRKLAIDLTMAEINRLANILLEILSYPPHALMGPAVILELQARRIVYHPDELDLAVTALILLRKADCYNGWFHKTPDPIRTYGHEFDWLKKGVRRDR